MKYFPYTEAQLGKLCVADPILGAQIKRIGKIRRQIIPDLFEAFVWTVTGQQISSKAAQTIFLRLKQVVGEVGFSRVAEADTELLHSCGLSLQKVSCIKKVAEAFDCGVISGESLRHLDEESFCKTFCAFKGVGRWTAEMLLIFSLCKKDVLSISDGGIRRGIEVLYSKKLDTDFLSQLRRKWSPYCTIASFYLWEIAAKGLKD